MSASTSHAQNSQNTSSTQAVRTGTFAKLTLADIERQGFGGTGREAYDAQPLTLQSFVAGCAEGALQFEIALLTTNLEIEEAIHCAKSALLLRLGLTGENLTIQEERERGFVIGLIDTLADAVADVLEGQQPAPADVEAPKADTPIAASDACKKVLRAFGADLARGDFKDAAESGEDPLAQIAMHLAEVCEGNTAERMEPVFFGVLGAVHASGGAASCPNNDSLAGISTSSGKAGTPADSEALTVEKRLLALIGAGHHLAQYIKSGDIVPKFEAPSNSIHPDPRRQAMQIFAEALAAAGGG